MSRSYQVNLREFEGEIGDQPTVSNRSGVLARHLLVQLNRISLQVVLVIDSDTTVFLDFNLQLQLICYRDFNSLFVSYLLFLFYKLIRL